VPASRKGVAVLAGVRAVGLWTTLEHAPEEWLVASEAGIIRTRTDEAYRPSAIRAFRQALNRRASDRND
jgi:hypothetical protein